MLPSRRVRGAVAMVALVMYGAPAVAGAPPNPPPPPPPRAYEAAPEYYPPPPPYPPPPYPPPLIVQPAPPPLSPVMRVIYAPFYAAGLVVRYGFYYVLVAPIEVFARALTFGTEGGVDQGDSQR